MCLDENMLQNKDAGIKWHQKKKQRNHEDGWRCYDEQGRTKTC